MTSDQTVKLHLGAFHRGIPGWINTDITPHIWITRVPFAVALLKYFGKISEERWQQHRNGCFNNLKYMDLARPLPFPDGSVSAVFSSHVLEHLFSDQIERLVPEIYRVLVPGGVCRVVVPDLEQIVRLY